MPALTADRATPRRNGTLELSLPVAAATRIHAGGMVQVSATGVAVRATATAANRTTGVAVEGIDNTAGAAGDQRVAVRRGCWQMANSAAADAITLAHIGLSCYVVDDQTVALTSASSTRPVAGRIHDVDAGGVWVEF